MKNQSTGDARGVFKSRDEVDWLTLANSSGLVMEFFPEGGLHGIRYGSLVLNQGGGTPLEGGGTQIYVRRRVARGWRAMPLLGPLAGSRMRVQADAISWSAEEEGLAIRCTLRLHESEPAWCWTMQVKNSGAQRVACDLLYLQDVGLASRGALRANEAFVSHYLDHRVQRDARWGYVIRTRQNQPQEGRCPGLLQGCCPGAASFATDALQFFGLAVKGGEPPRALVRGLPARILQGEMAAPSLQSRVLRLQPGQLAAVHFWAWHVPDLPAADTRFGPGGVSWRSGVERMVNRGLPPEAEGGRPPPRNAFAAPLLNGGAPALKDLREWFGENWRHVERRGRKRLSFFHGEDRHVVLPAKERATERPHGMILRSGLALYPTGHEVSATVFMNGVFLSYVTAGNLSFHRFLSICRDPLQVRRAFGLRLFVRLGKQWRLLGMPSAFEMSRDQARWIYKLEGRRVTVLAGATAGESAVRWGVQVEGAPLAFLVTHEVVAGQDFMSGAVRWSARRKTGSLRFHPDPREPMARKYPGFHFELRLEQPGVLAGWGGDEELYDDGRRRGYPYAVIRTRPVQACSFVLTGSVRAAGARRPAPKPDGDPWRRMTGGLQLELRGNRDVRRLDDMLKWQAQAALIHYLSPHGLEQFTGAAWGVRDVCQGPVEFLLALRKDEPVRRILKKVFAHQYVDTGLWPQWFMFDRYRAIQSRDSHGDVAIWPLKALCDYVETTSDFAILDEQAPYTRWPQACYTTSRETLGRHVMRLLDRIEGTCLPGLALIRYGHGDWDDTLQPCRRELAERQVSSWTVALLFQTLRRYGEVAARAGDGAMARRCRRLADRMREDFHRVLMPDGVVAGFALFPPGGRSPEQILLHPSDVTTGIRYRLISMTRGIISDLFTPEEARRHADLIQRHLTFPDGVRLVDRPLPYRGGRMQFFQRAETSAYCGRETGLMYVHAHLRYLEAMARLGRVEALWPGLMTVTPIQLPRTVPNAELRQSNTYYSSSEGAFATRYEMARRFGALRQGQVRVKGGWRIYSSGPGLYFAFTLNHLLGLRYRYGHLVVDPMLSYSLSGLTVERELEGRRVRIRYRVAATRQTGVRICINGQPVAVRPNDDNPFRAGGVRIGVPELRQALNRPLNEAEIESGP